MATGATTVACPQCGSANTAGNRFCGNCGGALPAAPPPAAAPVPPAPPVETAPVSPVPSPIVETGTFSGASPVPVSETPTPTTPAPVVAPPVAPVAAPTPSVPADPIARERERDRLLTMVNVQRGRGQLDDARRTLTQAIALSENDPPKQLAPTYELLGDMYATDGRLEEARAAFAKAQELDPARASAERKFATITLRLAESKDGGAMAQPMLRSDSLSDLLSESATGRKRNAGMAMFLSMVPGFGQFYNGQFVKGAVLLGIWTACLIFFAASPERDVFFRKFAAIVALAPGKGANAPVSGLMVFTAILFVGTWLYSIVDAPFYANKGGQGDGSDRAKIDKTGWEV